MFDDKLVTIIWGLIFSLINVELLFQLLQNMRESVNTQHNKRHGHQYTMYHLFWVMWYESLLAQDIFTCIYFYCKVCKVCIHKSSAQKLNFVILKIYGRGADNANSVGLSCCFYWQRIFLWFMFLMRWDKSHKTLLVCFRLAKPIEGIRLWNHRWPQSAIKWQ